MSETQPGMTPEQQKREAVEKLIKKFGGEVPFQGTERPPSSTENTAEPVTKE